MSPPCGRKRSNKTHFPSGDHTGQSILTSASENSYTFSGFPSLTGDTHKILWPTTSMIRKRSGENDMCDPPIISTNGCGSPPSTDTLIVAGLPPHVQRKITSRPLSDQRMKCPVTPTFANRRGLLPSARPNHAESATQTQPAALLTAVSRKSRIVKYDYVRVSWSVSPQERRSHTNSSLGDGCGILESNTPTATARCTVASARCTCCALRRTVGSSWARHT